jgi:periplasmic copper chaperone A
MTAPRVAALLLATALCGQPASAGDVTAGSIVVRAPFSRATPPGASVAGGYFSIENAGPAPDRLVSLTADVAPRSEIHEMKMDNGTMIMRPVAGGLVVPAGGKVELKPGGYHIMFVGIVRQLKAGETIKAVLTFEKAGPVTVDMPVVPLGAKAPEADAHSH